MYEATILHKLALHKLALLSQTVFLALRIMEQSRYKRGDHPNISTVGIVVSDWTYYKRVKESLTALRSITFMTWDFGGLEEYYATCLLYTSPSPRDATLSRMPSSA